jgi:hypothetical protein
MHRSGTSAATRLVNLLGVPLAGDDLLRETTDNPRGYWESQALTDFNDRVLAALGCDWTCPPPVEPGWETEPAVVALQAEAVELLGRVAPGEQWVWKDPRNCVTLELWCRVLDEQPVVLLLHRNPLEIATSLHARDGFDEVYSLALWERYVRRCLAATAGMPVLVSEFGALLADPVTWAGEVRGFLARSSVDTGTLPEDEARTFVDRELRHADFARDDFLGHAAVSGAQRELFLALEGLLGPHEHFVTPSLPAESPTTEPLLAQRRKAYVRDRDLTRQYLELEDFARSLGERFVALAQDRGQAKA